MPWETIIKPPRDCAVSPNLEDYEQERETFSWAFARCELEGLPEGNISILEPS